MAKELGSNIKYQLQAVFEAAFDEKSAKQVEKMYEKMSERVADSTREEFVQAFRSLGTAINDAFQKLSIPQIDIGKLIELPNAQMFNKLGEEFGAKFSEGFKGAVSGSGAIDTTIQEQIKKLEEQKLKLQSQQEKAPKRIARYKQLSNVTYMDQDEFKLFTQKELANMGTDVDEVAHNLLKQLDASQEKLSKELQYGTKEYYKGIVDLYQNAFNVFRMSRTLNLHPELVSDSSILENYDYDKLQEIYNADGFKHSLDAYSGDFDNFVSKQEELFNKIPLKIEKINAELQELRGNNTEIIDTTEAQVGLKTLNEIEEAYKRILNTKGKVGKQGKNIDDALNFDPFTSKKGIQTLYDSYQNLPDNSPWEVQYQALLKYVKLYESYLNSDNKTHHNKVTKPNNEFTKLYDQLKPMAANAENMLRNVLNMADNMPLVGMGGVEAEKFDDNIGITSEEIENANKITEAETKTREATEAKTKVNKENIEVAQKVAEAAEKEKIAQEAVAKAVEEKTKNTIIAEQKQSVGSNAERLLSDLSSVGGSDKEKFAYLNTGVGEISPHIEGGYEGVSKTARQELLNSIGGMWDSTLHTHPELIAAPSEEDIQSFVNSYDIFRKNFILAGQQLAEIDFSKLTQQQAQQLADTYKQNILNTDDDRVDRLTNTPLSELGVESVDIDSTLTKVFEQLKIQFPNLLTDINTYIENLRTAFKQTSITNLSQGELEDNIGDLVGENFQNSNQHIQADIYQTTKDVIDSVTKIPAMYQKELQGLFTQTIGNLGLDSSQIFKLHNVDDFQAQLDITRQQVQAHQENTTAINAETQAQENLNKTKIQQAQIEQSDKNVPDNTEELNSLRTQVEDANQRVRIAEQDAEKLRQELAKVQTTPRVDATGNIKISDAQITDEKILKEKASLEVLEAQIKTVIQAVNSKTAAFVQEGQQVGQVVGKEVSALIKLNTQVGEVNQTILELLGNTKTVVTTANKSKGISINVKTSDDGIKETSSEQKTEAAKKDDSSNKKSARDLSSLEKQYAQLGKMRAQYEQDGSHEQLAKLQNLAYEIKQKRESLKLTQEEIALMRKSLQLSYDAENRLIEGKAIDAQKKAEQKAEAKTVKEQQKLAEKLWKDQVKAAQASTGINAANSMMKSGQNSVINAIGTIGATDEFVNKAKDLSEQIQVLETLKNQIAEKGTVVDENDQKLLSTQINLVKQLKTEVDSYLAIHNKYSGDNSDEIGKFDASFNGLSREQQMQGLIDSIKANTEGRAVIKEIDNELGEVHYEVKTGTNEFTSYSAAIDNVDNSFKRLPGATKKTESMLDSIKRKFKEIFSYFSASSAIYRAFAELRKGVQYVREIDSALTELKKVTDETEETYEKFLNTASKMADKVGSTISEIVSSTADWSRLGYSMEEAARLAESTSVLLNVSEFGSIDEATGALTSTLQAFGYTASQSMNVVDVMNEVGNSFAVSSDGIATALQDSASALMTANNSYEEAVALIAAANRVVILRHRL